jgi:hypothetical protein
MMILLRTVEKFNWWFSLALALVAVVPAAARKFD